MASIVQRSNRYNVVYLYDDEATGKRKQKWESFSTLEDAKRRKAGVEYRQELGNVVIQQCDTLDDLLNEYVSIYGKSIWSLSVSSGNTGLDQQLYFAHHWQHEAEGSTGYSRLKSAPALPMILAKIS